MALSTILRRSPSRFMSGGNRIYGNLILPSASVSVFRQFSCSSSKDNEAHDAKRPSLNDLISQVQSLERDIKLLRNSSSRGVEESDSVHKGIDDDSFLKGIAIESSNDQVEDCESDKTDDDSKDQGKGSDSDDSSSDDDDSSSDEKSSTTATMSHFLKLMTKTKTATMNGFLKMVKRCLSKENEQLLKGIQAEILRAKTFMELSAPAAVIPADFPFKISDHYYSGKILMTQEYEGELVKVYVESPTIYMNSRPCNDYEQKKSSPYSMDLTVLVSDLSSKSMKAELKCSARPGGISVISVSDPADHEVHMSDVNGNLKEEFGKYLEARGITLSTTEFIYGYMLDKANKDRLRVLENVRMCISVC